MAMMTEQQLIEYTTRLIENYFGDSMNDVLRMDWEQAHAEIAKWMATESPDDMIPATWEMQIAYERVVEAQRSFQS